MECLTRLLEVIPNSLSCTQINSLQPHTPAGNWTSNVVLTPLYCSGWALGSVPVWLWKKSSSFFSKFPKNVHLYFLNFLKMFTFFPKFHIHRASSTHPLQDSKGRLDALKWFNMDSFSHPSKPQLYPYLKRTNQLRNTGKREKKRTSFVGNLDIKLYPLGGLGSLKKTAFIMEILTELCDWHSYN